MVTTLSDTMKRLVLCMCSLTTWLLLYSSLVTGCTFLVADPTVQRSFTSHPGYGSWSYPSNYGECWVITAPPGYQVGARTSSFDLESSYTCRYDRLEVLCGATEYDPRVDKYCGSTGPDEYLYGTEGGSLYFVFTTDSSAEAEGFRIVYEAFDEDDELEICENYNDDEYEDTSHTVGRAISIGILITIVIGGLCVVGIVVGVVCYAINGNKRRRGMVHANNRVTMTTVAARPTGVAMQQHANMPTVAYGNNRNSGYPQQQMRQGFANPAYSHPVPLQANNAYAAQAQYGMSTQPNQSYLSQPPRQPYPMVQQPHQSNYTTQPQNTNQIQVSPMVNSTNPNADPSAPPPCYSSVYPPTSQSENATCPPAPAVYYPSQ